MEVKIKIVMFVLAAIKFNVSIIHRFLECGHTQNEGDTMHAAIEKASSNRNCFCTDHWINIMKNARDSNPLEVIKVTQDFIFNFKPIVDHLNTKVNTLNEKIGWNNVREIYISHIDGNIIYYKHKLNQQYKRIDLNFEKNEAFDFLNYIPEKAIIKI